MGRLMVVLSVVFAATWTSAGRAEDSAAGSGAPESSVSGSTPTRDGWVLGIGPLGGVPLNNGCGDCSQSGAFGIDMQLGRLVTSELAILLDTHAVGVGRSDLEVGGISTTSVVQGVAAIAVQWWPREGFWLKGGLGLGQAEGTVALVQPGAPRVDLIAKEQGFGMTAAMGYELHQGRTFALDLHLRYAGIHTEPKYRGSLLLGLGLAWYL